MHIERKFYENPQFYLMAVIVFNCVYKSLIHYLHLPNAVNYLNDLMCAVLLAGLIGHIRRRDFFEKTRIAGVLVGLLFLETVAGYLLHLYSPLVYLWGLRTLFRFQVFFLAFIYYGDRRLIERICRFLYWILLLSVPLTTIQYLSGYGLDSVTGFFSAGRDVIGGSSGQNLLMAVVCTYTILQYFNKQCSVVRLLLPLLSSVYMAAIGEIKFFYFELVMIGVLCVFFTKPSLKKAVGILGILAVFVLGLELYNHYYGGSYYYTSRGIAFFSVEAVEEYIGLNDATYGRFQSLNRTSAVPYVWNHFLTDIGYKLLGLGAGYGDNVSLDILSSGFLKENYGLGYQLWGASLELTNVGLIGLGLMILLFIACGAAAVKAKKLKEENAALCEMTQVFSVTAVLLLFYNQSVILDITAPLLYFVLAVPFVIRREEARSDVYERKNCCISDCADL